MSTKNRLFWDATSASYQAAHGRQLAAQPLAWGVWRIPEAQVNALGPVHGARILELGCGAAQWTAALARIGARAVGVDLSVQQLVAARAHLREAGADAPLAQADAERLPFRSGCFDIVFCDHGAMVFAEPEPTVAEAARVLRPGGRFAFCMSTPIRDLCADPATLRVSAHLSADYFGMRVIDEGDSVSYQLPYGAWIRLFRRHGLVVEDLIELQAPPEARTTYDEFVPAEWARRWPAEHVWKLRKAATPARETSACAVRRLLPSDQAFLWEMLYQSLHVPAGAAPLPRDVLLRPEIARYVQGFGRDGDLGVVALETEDGPPVGAAWLRLLTGDARGYGYVDDDTPEIGMAVLAGFRGRGIGTTLLDHLLTLAAERYRKVCLSVSADNPVMRLYLRAGFTVVASSDGALTMVRRVGR